MHLHRPVMLEQALAGLAVRPGGIYLDATYGRGGHSRAILEALHGRGVLHALDRDPEAAAHAWRTFAGRDDFRFHARNFSELAQLGAELGLQGRVNGLLFDLGVSSPQLDDPARGFSFARDAALDMRMDPRAGEPASSWLARATESEIAEVLWRYGEERNSRRIARRIVEARQQAPLATTMQLARLIASVPGPHRHPPGTKGARNRPKIHPATRSFQAIRIFVNDELAALQAALAAAPVLLAPGGRLVVISFHSLEDRIVKRFIREKSRDSGKSENHVVLRGVGRYFPTDGETAENPRARSAVLRVAERLA